MQTPLQITFRAMPHSDALEQQVRRHVEKLERLCERLVTCHVVVEAAHRHHHHGPRYRVSIDFTVPGHELAVSEHRNDDRSLEDAHAAVDAAFDDAFRRVEDWVKRRRERARTADPTT